MSTTLTKLRELDVEEPIPSEEQAARRLLGTMGKDLVSSVFGSHKYHRFLDHVTPEMFEDDVNSLVWATILNYREETGDVPTREIVRDLLVRELTEDDPYDEILAVVAHKPDVRNLGYLMETLDSSFELLRQRQHYQDTIYGEAAQQALVEGNYELLQQIMRTALSTAPTTDNNEFGFASVIEMAEIAAQQQEWIVEDILDAGKTMIIAAPSKSFKTAILCDMAISIATGARFLNEFATNKSRRVLFVSAESDETDITDRMLSICESRNLSLEDISHNLIVTFKNPELGNDSNLQRFVKAVADKQVDVLMIDPVYLTLTRGSKSKVNSADVYDMGNSGFGRVRDTCREYGITPVLSHHFRKTNTSKSLELNNMSMAGAAEFARQSILMRAISPLNEDGEITLELRTHGQGRGKSYELQINEGRDEKLRWDIKLTSAREAIAEKKRTEQDQQVDRLVETLRSLSEENPEAVGFHKTRLRDEIGVSGNIINEMLKHALLKDRITATKEGRVTCYITKD